MELIYHYLWKNRLFGLRPSLDSGEKVDVIDPGLSNSDSGPDFFNSKVKIDGTMWSGNVEIHVRASDWYRHGHQTDTAYDTVILHVVGKSDREVQRTDGTAIPQMEIPLPKDFFLTYAELKADLKAVRCTKRLPDLPGLIIRDCMDSLGIERLQEKASRIHELLGRTGGDWNTAAFAVLARGLGFGLNSEPFEMLARRIPLKFLLRHSDNIFQLEALLFGQSGLLLTADQGDEYARRLTAEYDFLAKKYDLSPIPPNVWRFARTRPQNHPHRRIAYLARALSGAFPLPGLLKDRASDPESLRKIFTSWRLEGYWGEHYSFGVPATGSSAALSKNSVDLLMINVAAPYIYASASSISDPDLGEKALDILCSLPPEKNSLITTWNVCGLTPANAMESQALIQLRREYCDRNRCLNCRLGSTLLRRHLVYRGSPSSPTLCQETGGSISFPKSRIKSIPKINVEFLKKSIK